MWTENRSQRGRGYLYDADLPTKNGEEIAREPRSKQTVNVCAVVNGLTCILHAGRR